MARRGLKSLNGLDKADKAEAVCAEPLEIEVFA